MDSHVDRLSLIVEPGERGQQDQMARGRHRQKLGHALDDGHEEEVQQRHGGSVARATSRDEGIRSRAPLAVAEGDARARGRRHRGMKAAPAAMDVGERERG